jgi:hypothetical protein
MEKTQMKNRALWMWASCTLLAACGAGPRAASTTESLAFDDAVATTTIDETGIHTVLKDADDSVVLATLDLVAPAKRAVMQILQPGHEMSGMSSLGESNTAKEYNTAIHELWEPVTSGDDVQAKNLSSCRTVTSCSGQRGSTTPCCISLTQCTDGVWWCNASWGCVNPPSVCGGSA